MSRGKIALHEWPWSAGLAAILLRYLPAPLFRNRDVYHACDRLGVSRCSGATAWYLLRMTGRIVRTDVPIGDKAGTRGFYWERSHCALRVTDDNRRLAMAVATNVGRFKR